ncbi:MAG TPA: cupredoxin domain-containing protein [Candidatus Binataceae bacterium]|nr:cupredoxin domain-containing protein [Candidatus Binataceae bacterium]
MEARPRTGELHWISGSTLNRGCHPPKGEMQVRKFAFGLILFAGLAMAEEPEYVISIRDHHFHPSELTIPAETKVRIVIDNRDSTPEEFDSHPLNREKHVPANSKETIFIGPLSPGRYPFEGESRGDPTTADKGVLVVR